MAAGDYYIGVKRSAAGDTIIPDVVMNVYKASRKLQRRFPNPENLYEPDNILFWALREEKDMYPEIAEYVHHITPFSKYLDTTHAWDRTALRSLSAIPQPGVQFFKDPRDGHPVPSWYHSKDHGWRNVPYLLGEAVANYRAGGIRKLWLETANYFAHQWSHHGKG